MRINFNELNQTLVNMNNDFHVNAELYNYSDMHNAQSVTKVFKNYVKLYVSEKIALEIKFDKNTHDFKEFMCDAKRSRYVAEQLVSTFDFLEFRFTKKQTFVTCDDITKAQFYAVIYNAVFFALKYDADANTQLYKKACEMRK